MTASTTVLREIAGLMQAAAQKWVRDYAQSMGAALAFYTMFSIAPFLLIVIAVAGAAFGEEAARGEIHEQLEGMLGNQGALAVQGLIESAGRPADSVPAAAFGAVLLFVGATSVFAELQDALDRIWKAPERAGGAGLWRLVQVRLLSFGMILGIGFLLMVSLVFSAALAAASDWWGSHLAGRDLLVRLVNLIVSLATITGAFAMIYKVLPRASIAWADVWFGAAVTAALFEVGKLLIGLYVHGMHVATPFGAAGSLAVLMIWVYYSAQVFLFGAEFTWVYAYRRGSHSGEEQPEKPAGATVRS